MDITLSPSSLSLMEECRRCFWLQVNKGIRRPEGPFPSLPSGMDRVLKNYFDGYRKNGMLPPELAGKAEGVLFPDFDKLNEWRSNRNGLRYKTNNGAVLMGVLDDLLLENSGKYAPIDFKTRGHPLKENTHTYYQLQMDIYSFLLERNGMQQAGHAFLIFYHPKAAEENGKVSFNVETVKMGTEPARGEAVFLDGISALSKELPEANSSCGFCRWLETVKGQLSAKESQKLLDDFEF
ncbi:MAG: PD-(D/E)XK nuclease family protein [Candidatus Aenigmarchaeota archaeon]|nr:PD-(D/E)XK nuclease family protein [Candidatus Aenigmarchaeota archaeon]